MLQRSRIVVMIECDDNIVDRTSIVHMVRLGRNILIDAVVTDCIVKFHSSSVISNRHLPTYKCMHHLSNTDSNLIL